MKCKQTMHIWPDLVVKRLDAHANIKFENKKNILFLFLHLKRPFRLNLTIRFIVNILMLKTRIKGSALDVRTTSVAL